MCTDPAALPNRKHPFRWTPELYAEWRTPISVNVKLKPGRALDLTQLAPLVVEVLQDRAGRFGFELNAYCVMPTHLHFVCSAEREDANFGSLLGMVKSEICRRVRKDGVPWFAWQRSFWDRHSREEEGVRIAIQYVLDNAVRKGLCESWEQWPWSAFLCWPYEADAAQSPEV